MNEDEGFIHYKKGTGRVAEAALARVQGEEEWTTKHKRQAKWLKRKNRAMQPFRALRDRFYFRTWRLRRTLSTVLDRVFNRS